MPATAGAQTAARVDCGAKRHVSGGGVRSAPIGILNSTAPYDGVDADEIPDDGWEGKVDLPVGAAGEITVFAVCAR